MMILYRNRLLTIAFTLLLLAGNVKAQPAFFGTIHEGTNGLGSIYTTDADGNNLQTILDPENKGSYPSGKLLEVGNGIFLGLAAEGGQHGYGTIFEYNVNTSTYTVKYSFDDDIDDGTRPAGSLIKASDGKLYGLTEDGGIEGDGVIFEYDYSNDVYTKKFDLKFSTTGNQPVTSFLEASNGKLYALVTNGGVNTSGAIIEYDPVSNAVIRKADFINTVNGRNPQGQLMEFSGKLYGTTTTGGPNNGGTLFEYNLTTAALNSLVNFKVDANSRCTPMIASNGKLYGVTAYSGTGSAGELYEYDFLSSTVSYPVQFSDFNLKQGIGELLEITAGKLLGKCGEGGAKGYGGIFEYDIASSTLTVRANFDTQSEDSYESFTVSAAGNIYGLNPYGGTAFYGALYQFTPASNSISELYNFNVIEAGTNPASLVVTSLGKIYGVSTRGGIYDGGTLFEMNPLTYEITPLVQFKPQARISARVSQVAIDYSNPQFLMEASNGKLYGSTSRGGIGNGVIFEFDPATNEIVKKIDFDSNTGRGGSGSLLEITGKLYGTTRSGGPSGDGALFEYDLATSSITNTADFNLANVAESDLSLVLASNGKLYGVSRGGGVNNKGTIFEYDIATNTVVVKYSFTIGINPFGGLTVEADDKLLGLTYSGGTNSEGEVYEFTPSTSSYNTRASFDASDTGYPVGELLKAPNGNYYGLSGDALFEFDASTNLIAKKHDFIFGAGSRFNPHSLVETCTKPLFDQPDDVKQCNNTSLMLDVNSLNCDSYVWKRNGVVISGQNSDTLTIANAQGADSGTYTCELTNVCGTTIVTVQVTIDEIEIDANFNGTQVEVAASGGTLPYTYSSDGTDFQNSGNFLLSNGQYNIVVRDANNCETSSIENLVITGTNNWVESTSFVAYPNPATTVVNFAGLQAGTKVRLIDVSGKVVRNNTLTSEGSTVPLVGLDKGIYIVETTAANGRVAGFRLIKE